VRVVNWYGVEAVAYELRGSKVCILSIYFALSIIVGEHARLRTDGGVVALTVEFGETLQLLASGLWTG
jgi:hypothetical protein